ncbi:MAG: phosphoribosylamine--glycine ligase [Burkholderiales bacterium]
MKLLVIGSGGREHALAWKLARSPRISRVLVAPGNAGTAREDGLGNVAATSIPELIEVARKEAVGFTVVGPEAPLADGVVDAFRAEGLRIFGPTQAAARVVIEECLEGEEASFIVLADGRHALPLATSQDHKRLFDGDRGPNTGGMGAYSPAPVVTPAIHARVMREVIQPALAGMAKDGTPYAGFLYAGLMIGRDGQLKVLEFNCRLGDPETQPILLRLKSDLVPLIEHALAGTLDRAEADWDTRVALGVVLAAHGYPEAPRKGDAIQGLAAPEDDCRVFHAGTALNGKDIVTSGGRVLCVTALGGTVRTAQRRAYETAERIRFEGMQFRRDIGGRAVDRKK